MTKEELAAFGFFGIGIGFFLVIVLVVLRDSREGWERRMSEAREFGFGGPGQHTVKTLKGK